MVNGEYFILIPAPERLMAHDWPGRNSPLQPIKRLDSRFHFFGTEGMDLAGFDKIIYELDQSWEPRRHICGITPGYRRQARSGTWSVN